MLGNNSSTASSSSSTSASTSSTTSTNITNTTTSTAQTSTEPTTNNETQNLIEQFVQHHQLQFNNNNNNNNKQTLSRHHPVFENLVHQHHHHLHHHNNDIGSQSPKFTNRFHGTNMACQYVEINGQSNPQQQQSQLPPQLPPPIVHSTQATTAYLVQTPNGSALLIPPQTALNPTSHFLQTNATAALNSTQQQQQQQNNTFSLNRNPYGITTIPLQNAAAILNSNPSNTLIPHSSSVASGACFNTRPESTTSTNVYQTIDTEK